jgi:enoyl-CoA hydratase/carnithine racemase
MELACCSTSGCRQRARQELGIVTRVVPDDELDAEAEKLALRLAQARSARTARSSGCCAGPRRPSFSKQLEDEAHTIAGLSAAPTAAKAFWRFWTSVRHTFGEP